MECGGEAVWGGIADDGVLLTDNTRVNNSF